MKIGLIWLFEKWLSRIAFLHEGFIAFKGEQREEDRRSTNRDKLFSKTSNFSASSNLKETKQMQSDHCPLADGTNKIWNYPLFRILSVNDWYAAVWKQHLWYGCLGKGHVIKDCKVNACGINGCIKKHNRLLHPQNNAVNVNTATTNQSRELTSFLQIVPVSIQSGGNRLNTYAFIDSGSTVSFIDESVQEKLRTQGTDVTLNIAGIHGTKDLKTEKIPLKTKGLHSKVHSIEAFAHPSVYLGNKNYNYNKLQSLKCFTQQKFYPTWWKWHHPWSRCLWATMPIGLQDRNTKWNFRRSNRARTGSQWTHDGQKKTKFLSFSFHRRCEAGWEYSNLVGNRNLCFQNQRRQSVKEGTAGT